MTLLCKFKNAPRSILFNHFILLKMCFFEENSDLPQPLTTAAKKAFFRKWSEHNSKTPFYEQKRKIAVPAKIWAKLQNL